MTTFGFPEQAVWFAGMAVFAALCLVVGPMVYAAWVAEATLPPRWPTFCFAASLGSVLTWLLISLTGCAAVDKPRLTLDAQASVAAVSKQVQSRIEAGEINVPITIGDGALLAGMALFSGVSGYPLARAVRKRWRNGRVPPEVERYVNERLEADETRIGARLSELLGPGLPDTWGAMGERKHREDKASSSDRVPKE